jgi:site-specific recombinase XerD
MNRLHLVARYMEGFFRQYLGALRGVSDKTILAYRDAIKLLLCFAADRFGRPVDELALEHLDDKAIISFLDHVEKERHCCIRTRNARLAAISTFFNYAGRQEPSLLSQCHAIRTIPYKRDQHRALDYLDDKEIRTIFESIDPSSRTGARDQALMLFLFNTGARVQECIDVTIDRLRLDSQGQVTLLGKGRKERSCPLWPETVRAIVTYLSHRNPRDPHERRLFMNANGKPVTRFGVRHLVRKYAQKAGANCVSIREKTVGPHTWRHSTAVHMLQAGNDINMVAMWLGHADANTTHVYAEINMAMKRKMLTACPPPTGKTARRAWQKPSTIRWLEALSEGSNYVQHDRSPSQ